MGSPPPLPSLVSGEGVRLDLPTAGVASRMVAVVIDAAVQFAALLVLVLADAAVFSATDSAAAAAVLIVEFVAVLAGYPIVMEWATRGRTVGKLCLGLRVVRDDGGPIGFRQALVRGLAGLVLEKPGLLAPLSTLAGVLTVSASEREKRLGDMMAGTVVLNERASGQDLLLPAPWVPVALQPWALSLDLHRLDDPLALRVRQFLARAHAMTPDAQYALGADLLRRVLDAVSPQPPPGVPPGLVLICVLAERRRRASMPAGAFATPLPPPPQYKQPSRYQPPTSFTPPG